MDVKMIVEIPRYSPARVTTVNSERELIQLAEERHGFIYHTYGIETALESWGSRDQMPSDLLAIFESGERAVEFGEHFVTEFVPESKAKTELEYAEACLFQDLYGHLVLTQAEARLCANGDASIYSGHKCFEVQRAVGKVLANG